MRYSQLRSMDISNGNGVGVSLFVQGCPLHCEGCFNKELWDFNKGLEYNEDVENKLLDLLSPNYISRFTLLGGEPLADQNIRGSLDIIRKVRNAYNTNKQIWLYTGYTYEELVDKYNRDILEILSLVDVLVDGRFELQNKDLTLAFKGSTNQRIIDMKATLKQNEIILYNH